MPHLSIQSLESEMGRLAFYAPVFAGVNYRFADAVEDYSERFLQAMPSAGGPITFGEVAYQLLNQTAVYLTLEHG